MATVRELVPLFKTAIADVLAANPSSNDDVMYALDRVRREWIMPEVNPGATEGGNFEPSPPEPPDTTEGGAA